MSNDDEVRVEDASIHDEVQHIPHMSSSVALNVGTYIHLQSMYTYDTKTQDNSHAVE